MPYNSCIDVFNFSSPKDLADYLKTVGSDMNIYITLILIGIKIIAADN
jgi:hypothetical protein